MSPCVPKCAKSRLTVLPLSGCSDNIFAAVPPETKNGTDLGDLDGKNFKWTTDHNPRQNTITFVADEETFYYVERGLYVAAEGGGYVMSEPPLGSTAAELPDGATVINEEGELYFQFDTVFFKPVDSGEETAYEVIPSPDGSEVLEEDAEET